MGQSYAAVSLFAKDGVERFENTFHYVSANTAADTPSASELANLLSAWAAAQMANYKSIYPTTSTIVLMRAIGWSADGTPSGLLPVDSVQAVAGTRTPFTRDGNAHVGILKPGLGPRVIINGAPGPLNRAYWAFGPLTSADIDDAGLLLGSGGVPFTSLQTTVAAVVAATGGVNWAAIKVSHTDAHVIKPSIHAYRAVTGSAWRLQTSFRRSRNNNK